MQTPHAECLIASARAENQLLISVARRSLDAAREEQIHRLVRAELDWPYLLATARRHGLLPLLYLHLNSLKAAVPAQVLGQLQEDNRQISRSNLSLTAELIKLLDLLAAHGIHAIPFKGPLLGLWAYGDVALRQFTDLDILVHKTDVTKVKELLVDRGFNAQPELTRGQEAALLRFDCAYTFVNAKGVVLDVHWDFAPRYCWVDLDVNRMWGRLEQTTIGRKQLLTLSAEDLLFILCLHGFTHLWDRLSWICDIASLIGQRKNLDWQCLLQNATKLGSQRILSLGLLLANDLLDAPVPLYVLEKARAEPAVVFVAAQLQEQLLTSRSDPTGLLDEARLHLMMRERKRDQLRACLTLVSTPRSYDWMFLSLPDSLFFLHYLLRPLRLAGTNGAKLLRNA